VEAREVRSAEALPEQPEAVVVAMRLVGEVREAAEVVALMKLMKTPVVVVARTSSPRLAAAVEVEVVEHETQRSQQATETVVALQVAAMPQ